MHPRSKRHLYQSLKCTNVNSTIVLASIWRLCKRRIDYCTSIELAVVQASIRRFQKRQFDSCTSVESKIVETLNRRIHRRMEGYIDYIKKVLIFLAPSVPR